MSPVALVLTLVGVALAGWIALRVGEGIQRRRAEARGVERCRVTIRRNQDRWYAGYDARKWWWVCTCQPGQLRFAGSQEEAQVAADGHLREKVTT